VHYRDKTATFAGHMVTDVGRKKPPFWIHNFYENQILFSSYHLNKENLKYYVEKLLKFKPKLIWGYPSSIYLIASFLENENVTEIRPHAIFTSSETLLDFQRERIETAFNTKVYNYYANSEIVANILECEKGMLHISHEHGLIEFLDKNNKPVEYGQEGRMVCTGFTNYAMPLIRYDTGDVAIPIKKKCKCGRKGPLVEKIIGRNEDYITTPDGRFIGRLDHIFKNTKNVEEAQIIQENRNLIILKIVKKPEFTNKDKKEIVSSVQERIGKNMNIEFEFVDHIPRLSNGKFKFVISKLNLEL